MPRPFRMTRRGVLRTLFAVRAMPMAPSAAAKDSWPARKAKQVGLLAPAAWRPDCRGPDRPDAAQRRNRGWQKACRPSPMAAGSTRQRLVRPRFSGDGGAQGVSPDSVIKADGLDARARSCTQSMPLAIVEHLVASVIRDSLRPLALQAQPRSAACGDP